MKPVAIIGMGMNPDDLTARHLKIIEKADVLIGGKRLLNHFKDSSAQKISIGKNVGSVIDFVKHKMKKKNVVVLASGDPMFFGIGARMVAVLGPEHTAVYPNITSISAAFARLKEPWSEVRVISLHGKKNESLLFKALENENTVAVFTDPKNNPARLAARLLEKDMLNFQMCVLETLGNDTERYSWYHLPRVLGMRFSEPNMVVLKRSPIDPELKKRLYLGAPDSWYDHPAGLITKAEVRAITLSKLRLSTDHIIWDLGAGSGSVSIETSLFVKKGKIFAIEQHHDRVEQIQHNKKQFGVNNLQIIHAVLPKGLSKLPRPDRIFIGGGGKDLKEIVSSAALYLKPDGIMVINTVLIPNIQVATTTLKKLGFETDVIQVQINRSQEMPWAERLEAQNPVWIITGRRKAGVEWRKV
jgi:precorrin-6Y C5,15-methyltransferase (decarboxylating)